VEAFVCRKPDENAEELYRFLLRRNARLYGVAFSLDPAGDVYLVGRLPLHAITADEVDRILGSVLEYADDSFDRLLEIGFAGSIRREWAWRQKNGESTRNLQAFARFADPDRSDGTVPGRLLPHARHPCPAPPRRERVELQRTCSPAGSTST
jgi:hypothetical protein